MSMQEFHVDPMRYAGRPDGRRSDAEDACYILLDALKIDFFRADHDPAMTIPMCHAVERVLGAPICKNLFLCNRQKTQYFLLLMQGDKVFKTKYLSAQLGCSRLSFADGDDMQKLLGVTPGSASLLALRNDVEKRVNLVIDRPVLSETMFAWHPCINTSTVAFSTEALQHRLLPALGRSPSVVDLPEEIDE